ncbi:MAG: fibronectin type III domain-containing protein [Verrucomicrobiota bacterium]
MLRLPRLLSVPTFLAALLLTSLRAVTAVAAEQLTVKQESPGQPGGYIVEYVNHPTDEWVILGFIPAGKNTFTHPRLAPGTPYHYRVRPFYGAASQPVEVTVAESLTDQAYAAAYAQPEDYSWAPPRTVALPGGSVLAAKSLKDRATAASAAPAQFRAELARTTVSGFKLSWHDRSSDEEGFLLEQVTGPSDFTVCAVIDPNINAFGWALEPPARKATFRLRAYYYGPASNVVAITTGGSDSEGPKLPAKPAPAAKPTS